MSYKLLINGATADLFPGQEVALSFDYYNSQSPESVRIPFSFEQKLPYTTVNKAIFQYNDSVSLGNVTALEREYSLYINDLLVSSGVCRFVSVTINSTEPFFNIEFNDNVSDFSKKLKDLKFSDIYSDAFSTTERTLSTYLNLNQDYQNRDIEIPFIDVDDIQKRDGFPSRQFTTWGIHNYNVGLFPALSVQSFFSRVFGTLGFDVYSKFIDGISSWTSNDLYVLYPTALSGTREDTRLGYIFPFPYNVTNNVDQTTLDPIEVDLNGTLTYFNAENITNYKILLRDTYEAHGPTNYDPSAENDIDRVYAYQHRTSSGVTDYGDENIGYIAYSNEFDAKFSFASGSNSLLVSGLNYTILSSEIEYYDSIIPTAIQIYGSSLANAEFTPYLDIYAGYVTSASPTYRIPLVDEQGLPLKLTAVSVSNGTGMDFPDAFSGSEFQFLNFANTLNFDDFTAYIDDSISYSILGGTRYSYGISVAMTSGSLTVNHLTTKIEDNVVTASGLAVGVELRQSDVMKSRVHGYSWPSFGLKITNHSRVIVSSPGDVFTFADSFENNTSVSVYDLFVDLMKRFNLSIIYDYRPSKLGFILDNVNDIRDAVVPIDQYIDDAKEYEVSLSTNSPKNLKLLNKDNEGLYDSFENGLSVGSYDGQYDINGNGDYSIEFITGLINPIDKSVCGKDDVFNDDLLMRDGLISVQEVGQIKGQIRKYNEIGLRIFYLSEMANEVTLRYPRWVRRNSFGQLIDQNQYKVLGNIKLQGYPSNVIEARLDLRFATRNGVTLDGYDYITNSEKFKAAYESKISFYAAFPVFYFNNGYFFNKKLEISETGETVVISSFTDARLYDDYVYGKVEAIFVD